jgi:hypothetical protein
MVAGSGFFAAAKCTNLPYFNTSRRCDRTVATLPLRFRLSRQPWFRLREPLANRGVLTNVTTGRRF